MAKKKTTGPTPIDAIRPQDTQVNIPTSNFNGLPRELDQRVDFSSHESSSQPHGSSRMILGDSLTVMTSLAEKEGLRSRVQTISFELPSR